jgi:hypothetical protein
VKSTLGDVGCCQELKKILVLTVGKDPRNFSRGGSSRPPPYGNRVIPRAVRTIISMPASATSHSSPTATQASPQPSRGAVSREWVRGEVTHFKDHHMVVCRIHLVLLIGGVGEPITNVTVQSHNQALCIEKERPR